MFRYHTKNFFVSTTRVKNVLMNCYKEKIEKNAFLPFSATRWGRNHSETPFSDSQRPIAPIDTPYPTLYLFGVRNCYRKPEKYPHFFHFCPKISWPIFFQLPESVHMWLILWSNVVKIIVNCSQNYGPIMVQIIHLCLNKVFFCESCIFQLFSTICGPIWLDCGPNRNVKIEPYFLMSP